MMSANSGFPSNTVGGMSGLTQQFNQMNMPENTQSTLEVGYSHQNPNYRRSHERFDTLGFVPQPHAATIEHELDAPLIN